MGYATRWGEGLGGGRETLEASGLGTTTGRGVGVGGFGGQCVDGFSCLQAAAEATPSIAARPPSTSHLHII
jgi:hypothetical protein